MSTRTIEDVTNRASRLRPPFGAGEVASSRAFRKLCEYQQMCADRSGATFSVICFSFRDRDTLATNESTLKNILIGRVRQIDEVGHMAGHQLGILAPLTCTLGADVLAAEIASLLPSSIPQPSIKVYEYRSRPRGTREDRFSSRPARDRFEIPNADVAEILVHPRPLWKRLLDTLGAAAGLVLLAPVFLLIAMMIKMSSKGPVIFAQQRTGRGGKPFWIYKFRSMVVGAEGKRDGLSHLNEQDGPAFKIQHDPRITWIGHLLRRLSLDELPQLWNVLKGDMSFVGPRPLPCDEADKCAPWQRRRMAVTPGITCIWQVQDRSIPVPFAEWMRMDIRYANAMSPKQDLKLLFATVGFLIGRRNR